MLDGYRSPHAGSRGRNEIQVTLSYRLTKEALLRLQKGFNITSPRVSLLRHKPLKAISPGNISALYSPGETRMLPDVSSEAVVLQRDLSHSWLISPVVLFLVSIPKNIKFKHSLWITSV